MGGAGVTGYLLDGPHTPATVIGAARDIDGLVRYLNHATRGHTLDNPADLYLVLGALFGAVMKLPQLVEQFAAHADRYVMASGLFDDRGGNPAFTAMDVREHLQAAHAVLLQLIDPLRGAHEACSRLGVQTPKENP